MTRPLTPMQLRHLTASMLRGLTMPVSSGDAVRFRTTDGRELVILGVEVRPPVVVANEAGVKRVERHGELVLTVGEPGGTDAKA